VINDKKRSLLKVPKSLMKKHHHLETLENLQKSFETPVMVSPIQITTPKPPTSSKLDPKSSSTCKSARMTIISSNRYRENPNKENLKTALEAISKLPPIQKELKKEQLKQDSPKKSDIEKLIESQTSGNSSKFHQKLTKMKNLERLKIDSSFDKERVDDKSQNSDPSPVRKVKKSSPERRGNSQRFLKCKKKKESFLSLLKKIQNSREAVTQQSPSSSSDDCEDYPKNFDYQQESLRILKNTSTFATKIMKNIRQARHKNF
jgi:hypothetical protein